MSFWSGLVDSVSSIFSYTEPEYESNNNTDPYSVINRSEKAMEVGVDGSRVTNERIAAKVKGYYDLATGEIDKAVRAEEWGLIDDALWHYRNAQRILAEGASTYVPSFISSSEKRKVDSYHQKISEWQGRISERLQVLSARAGSTAPNKVTKITASLPQRAKNLPRTNAVRDVQQKAPSFTRSSSLVNNRTDKPATSKSSQDDKLAEMINKVTKITALLPQRAKNLPRMNAVRDVQQKAPSFTSSSLLVNNQTDKPATSKSSQDDKLAEMINNVIVDRSPSVKWDDVAGLELAKQTLFEMVILPTKRRDLFTGLRRPPRGLLLFGPPGNGKTMLAKAVASECNATFFNVSASTLTSKWVGEGEKLVRTLFMVAIARQPSVIFMDEIDSMLSSREANEHDASRRLKSEFLVQFDGVTSNSDDLVIVIGATNKPQELDDAVLRRLVKRIYIPLPDESVRKLVLKQKLKGQAFSLPRQDLERLAKETEGYSGSDLQALCEEAAMMPIRELGSNILTVKANQVRPLKYDDFRKAMSVIRPSLHKSRWEELERWNQQFGAN